MADVPFMILGVFDPKVKG